MSFIPVLSIAETLAEHHYLGPIRRGFAWTSPFGVMAFAHPTSRNLPSNWLELTRWCIISGEKNAGSRMWGAVRSELAQTDATTLVSYSDPSVGHTGALYRACNWLWAPTWHRLRPPPTGNGAWSTGVRSAVKDRWVFPLRPDPQRVGLLTAKDESVLRKMPYARYSEPKGADYKQWLRMQYV